MTDRSKGKPPTPQVQVIRKGPAPTGAPSSVPGAAPVPAPVPVRPSTAPAAASPRPVGAPSGPPRSARPPFRGPPRSNEPRPPATPENIAALAQKERVPNRIAKGELDGKMKCRIWKKLHAEEAKRFQAAWTLLEATPGLELSDAFGIVQSGMTVEEFRARRARAKRREAIKEARSTVAAEPIDAFIAERIAQKNELAAVMGERTILDVFTAVAPVSFTGERTGLIEKLHLVALARRTTWDALSPRLERDPKLSQKPASVPRQPARRPVSDPRAFIPEVGKKISLQLRNGIKLEEPLLAVGPFDVLVGAPGDEIFVPLHAMVSWTPVTP